MTKWRSRSRTHTSWHDRSRRGPPLVTRHTQVTDCAVKRCAGMWIHNERGHGCARGCNYRADQAALAPWMEEDNKRNAGCEVIAGSLRCTRARRNECALPLWGTPKRGAGRTADALAPITEARGTTTGRPGEAWPLAHERCAQARRRSALSERPSGVSHLPDDEAPALV